MAQFRPSRGGHDRPAEGGPPAGRENSVADRRERLRDAIRSYHNFVDAFGQSGRLSEAERMYDELIAELERIQRTTTP